MTKFSNLKELLQGKNEIKGTCYYLARLYIKKGSDSCKKGSNYWCCHEHYEPLSYDKAVSTLVDHVKTIIKELGEKRKHFIEEFTIGKTHVDINLKEYLTPETPGTWDEKYKGIQERWKDYIKLGYHCHVVICCITKEIIPERIQRKISFNYTHEKTKNDKKFTVDQQTCALAMEQRLIHHFMFREPDSRLRNHSLATGKEQEKPLRGGIVYVAFKFKEELLQGKNEIKGTCYYLARLYKKERSESCKKGSNWWCCNKHYGPLSYDRAVSMLVDHVKTIIKELEEKRKHFIEEFTIGKTHVNVNLSEYLTPENPGTWDDKFEGIQKRWKGYSELGYHCHVVICCITKEMIPKRIQRNISFIYKHEKTKNDKKFTVDQQTYALAMEQRLIHHFMFREPNSRLRNHSLATGKEQENPLRGGIVYVAFKFKENSKRKRKSNPSTETGIMGKKRRKQRAAPKRNIGPIQIGRDRHGGIGYSVVQKKK